MNNSKIALLLLVLPFFVMADNPVAPLDKDAPTKASIDSVAQVESRSESIESYDTSSSYSDSMGIEDVIVTATRRETSLMETPIAISAVTQEQLTQYGISNIKDLSYSLPGLSIQNMTDTSAPIITLRGIRSNNVTEVGDPAVGIHVDGLYVARPQGAAALMFDLERAELSRGPQGTLYGRNSIVGSLNIVTAKPNLETQGGSITINAGRFNEQGIQGHYNLPINDKLAIRLAFSDQSKDSYLNGYYDGSQPDWRFLPQSVQDQFTPITDQSQKVTGTDYAWYLGCQSWQAGCWTDPGWQFGNPQSKVKADPSTFYNNVDNHAYRLSALYMIDETSDINVQYEVFQDDGAGWQNTYSCEMMAKRTGRLQGDPAVYPANTCSDLQGTEDRYTSYVNVPGVLDINIESFRVIYNKDLGDYDLTAKLGTQELTQYSQWDTDGGANAAYDMAFVIEDYKAKSTVIDIELKNKSDELAWVVGAFYMKEDNDMLAYFHATLNGDSIFDQPNRIVEATAVFGQATYKLRDDLFLTVGARYTEEEKSDEGGKNWECSMWNSCYTSGEIWGNRTQWLPQLNALAPNFHVAGGQYAGVNCTAGGGPYGGGPYYGGTGCMVQTTSNDVAKTYHNFDWRLGLDFDISDTAFVYGYLATGFKAGSITDVYVRGSDSLHPEGPGSVVNTSYGPEDALTFEMGYKGRYLENRLNIALNYYNTSYDGKQFTGNVPVDSRNAQEYDYVTEQLVDVVQVITIWGTQNFGKQEMSGVEFEFDFIPYEGGKLSGWVTQMDTEVTSDFITQWYYAQDAQFGRPDYGASIANSPENAVNLKGNETPYSPNLALTVRYEHTFNLGSMGTLAPAINYHWQAEDYLTIWNADKHVNDAGGYGTGGGSTFVDLPGYFQDPVDQFGDQRPSWDMLDLVVTYKPAGDASWYAQAYAYNVTDEEIAWFRGVEAGQPRGSYSAPSQYGLRLGYYW
jgi:iron complex outermembrane receptor protein